MLYIIQTVPSRNVDHILEQIPDAKIYVDENKDPTGAYIEILKMANGRPFVRLEDDIELADNFKFKVEKEIKKRPNEYISFFTLKNMNKKTEKRAGRTYCMAQATYYPLGQSFKILEYYSKGWEREKEHPTGLDFLLADYLKDNKIDYWITYPNLVQHKKVKSLINPSRSKFRQSKHFKRG